MTYKIALAAILTSGLVGCGGQTDPKAAETESYAIPEGPRSITGGDLLHADRNTSEWLSYGRTWSEQRYSPLQTINRGNVSALSLAWYADLDTARGQEATPLVVDGKIYTTTAWSKVLAFDAASGEPLWEYDPEVPGETGVKACCDVVNRGLATWQDKLYFGTLDGRLIALDRNTGEPVWTTHTFESDAPYTITGAPRVIDGLVIIGSGGADMGPVRGNVAAYDAETGEEVWRFYTVPDAPSTEDQPEYLKRAADTWTGEWWELGGGGTVWDAMAYDPELGLLYIGVGNGAPWNQQFRSPEGGDNLYLSSIVAIDAKTGEYAWHFQTTPGETWDFTATQHIILAELELDGQQRKVLMQAPKNGFFYVLDRETGEFLSANNYTNVTWAVGIDPKTGRPIEAEKVRYKNGRSYISPGALGGHNWHPMAYNPEEELVYIPVHNAPQPYGTDDSWTPLPLGWNTAVGSQAKIAAITDGELKSYDRPIEDVTTSSETPASYQPVEKRDLPIGALVAWDPKTQSEKWRVDHLSMWNGGVLTTGGGLVFQGTATGDFRAYNSSDGTQLWSYPIQTGAIAAPMTFELDGEQHIALLAGWGGVLGLRFGFQPNRSRLLVFKLDGTTELPAPEDFQPVLDPPTFEVDEEQAKSGAKIFSDFCGVCHGDGKVLPNLKFSGALHQESTWMAIVKDGALKDRGMVSFSSVLTDDELLAVRQYIVQQAQKDAPRTK